MTSIDNVKKFWNTRPCNVRHSEKEIGTKEYFDEVEKKKFFVEPHIKSFSHFNEWNGKKVLEIGCGLATAGINFARFGSEYTGVELSLESLDLAKKRFFPEGSRILYAHLGGAPALNGYSYYYKDG